MTPRCNAGGTAHLIPKSQLSAEKTVSHVPLLQKSEGHKNCTKKFTSTNWHGNVIGAYE